MQLSPHGIREPTLRLLLPIEIDLNNGMGGLRKTADYAEFRRADTRAPSLSGSATIAATPDDREEDESAI